MVDLAGHEVITEICHIMSRMNSLMAPKYLLNMPIKTMDLTCNKMNIHVKECIDHGITHI